MSLLTGMSPEMICHYEAGRFKPRRSMYPIFAKALGVSVLDFELAVLETEYRMLMKASNEHDTPCEVEQ